MFLLFTVGVMPPLPYAAAVDWNRRPWTVPLAATALLLATACTGGSDETAEEPPEETGHSYVTRPDLTPPKIELTEGEAVEAGAATEDHLVFLGVKDKRQGAPMNGLVIADRQGQPVFVDPQGDTRWAYDLRVQEYEGEPVLTWWRGDTSWTGYGEGEFVLMDQSYDEIATVTTTGTPADFHDVTLTDEGTALMMTYPLVQQDLTEVGGPADGWMRGSIIQEVDVETGEVLFEWDALDHVPMTESAKKLVEEGEEGEDGSKDAPYDPYHFNSVTVDEDALLISARNTHAVYRVDRESGDLDWTLGGPGSDFEMEGDSSFAWQHDAHRQPDGTITLFDNQAAPKIGDNSRGLTLDVDTDAMTASVVREYLPPKDQKISESQGNMRVLDDGTVFIGWGSIGAYTHYTADGEVIQHAELAGGISYRAYLQEWVGRPSEPPKFVIDEGKGWVSWNGATEVAQWRFVAGPLKDQAEEVETVPADAFEVSAEMPDAGYVGVEALNAEGEVIATAEPGSWPN